MRQAHELHDNLHDLDLSIMDAKTVGEVRMFYYHQFRRFRSIQCQCRSANSNSNSNNSDL